MTGASGLTIASWRKVHREPPPAFFHTGPDRYHGRATPGRRVLARDRPGSWSAARQVPAALDPGDPQRGLRKVRADERAQGDGLVRDLHLLERGRPIGQGRHDSRVPPLSATSGEQPGRSETLSSDLLHRMVRRAEAEASP